MLNLTEEDRANIKVVIDCIRDFEAGNDERYEEVESIIEEMINFSLDFKKYLRKMRLIMYIPMIVAKVMRCPEDTVKSALVKCNNEYDFVVECYKELRAYLIRGSKSGDYPDLEAAYLFSIYLNEIFNNIEVYIEQIESTMNAYLSDYSYTVGTKKEEEISENHKTMERLLEAIRVRQ